MGWRNLDALVTRYRKSNRRNDECFINIDQSMVSVLGLILCKAKKNIP
jgi:hypothetical protein